MPMVVKRWLVRAPREALQSAIMYTRHLRRIILIPLALFCIIVSFLAIASAIDLFRTLILLDWKSFFAVVLVLLILFLAVAELAVLFGLYYWLAASEDEHHMGWRAALACTVLFPIIALSSFGKIATYLRLDMGFFEVQEVAGIYPHLGVYIGAGGFIVSLVVFLILHSTRPFDYGRKK
jgi:hypothetical protein